MMRRLALRLLLPLAGLLAWSASANAAPCSSPAGNPGDMVYASNYGAMAYCNNIGVWTSMAGGVSLTVNTSGGGATPAGSSADVQFNSSGALAADTGNFTYASGLLKAPNISTTAITASGAGTFGTVNSAGLGTFGSALVNGGMTVTGQASITTISTTLMQLVTSTAACTSGLAGAQRYNSVSNTIDYCTGSAWMSLGPSATVPVGFLVTRNGVNQTIVNGSEVLIDWTTKGFDTNSNFNLTTDRFTPTIPGYYLLQLEVTFDTATGSALTYGYIRKNGGQIASHNSVTYGSHFISTISYANGSTDYFDAATYQATGSTANLSGLAQFTYFTGSILSPQAGGGGGSAANPAGSSNDIQFNSGGLLAADTGKFTYASSTLAAPSISATALNGQYGSITTLYNPGSFSGNTAALNSVSSTLVSASTISGTLIQAGQSSAACGSGLVGSIRYASDTLQICKTTGWTNLSSALSNLADVSISNLSGRDYLRYDYGSSKWVNVSESTVMSTTTIEPGWPDVIVCTTATQTYRTFFRQTHPNGSGVQYGLGYDSNAARDYIQYDASGNYSSHVNESTADCVTGGYTIAQLYARGQAFNLIGGLANGGSGASGDRITSGTLSIIANSGSAYASLTTNGTTWGYLSSNASFVPYLQVTNLNAGYVSSTLVQTGSSSATCGISLYGTIRWNATSDTIQICNTAGWTSVASSSVPNTTTSQGRSNYAAIFSGPNTLVTDSALYVDRTNHRIGIGTDAPSNTLTVSTTTNPMALFVTNGDGINPVIQLKDNSPAQGRAGSINFLNGAGVAMGQLAYATGYNYMRMTTSGTERMRIVSTGEVGIGTVTPASSLTIAGEAQVGNSGAACVSATNGGAIRYSAGTLSYCNGSNTWTSLGGGGGTPAGNTGDIQFNTGGSFDADTGRLYWDKTNDRLGIGTGVPSTTLHVMNPVSGLPTTLTIGNPSVTGNNNNDGIISLYGENAGVTSMGTISQLSNNLFLNPNGGSGNVIFVGHAQTAAGKRFIADDATDTKTFQLYHDGTNAVMSVSSGNFTAIGGNVGIGTSSPGEMLDIVSNTRSYVRTHNGTATMYSGVAATNVGLVGTISNHPLVIYSNNAERMRFDTNGNIGIGATLPSTSLYVNGQIGGGFGAMTTSGVADFNDISNARAGNGYTLLQGSTASNGPNAGTTWWHPFNFEFGTSKLGSGNMTQFAIPYGDSGSMADAMYMRGRYSGTWTGWYKFITSNPLGDASIPRNLTATAFLYSSDQRLKGDITTLTGGLAKLDELNPVSFRFTADPSKTIHLGLIAQDVQKVYPEAVKADDKGFLKLDYPALIGPVVGMLKELKSIVLADHVELEAAKAQIRELRASIDKLNAANGVFARDLGALKAANDKLNAANGVLARDVGALKAANDNMRVRMDVLERSVGVNAR